MGDYPHIEVEKNGEVFVVCFQESKILDDLVIENVAQDLYGLAESAECTNLLLNFSTVDFLSSSMLGKLTSLNKRMKAKAGRLKLCEMKPQIVELFNLTGLNRVFDIQGDQATGVQAFY